MSTRRRSSSFRGDDSCSRARCCVSRGCARRRRSSAARKSRTRKCRARGGKSPLSTHLASRVRAMLGDLKLAEPAGAGRDWLELQQWSAIVLPRDEVLIETFPHAKRYFMVAYPFEGRLAHHSGNAADAAAGARARTASGFRRDGLRAVRLGLRRWGRDDRGRTHRFDALRYRHAATTSTLGWQSPA